MEDLDATGPHQFSGAISHAWLRVAVHQAGRDPAAEADLVRVHRQHTGDVVADLVRCRAAVCIAQAISPRAASMPRLRL